MFSAGKAAEKEFFSHFKKGQKKPAWQIVNTSAGHLSAKGLIHVIIPWWAKDEDAATQRKNLSGAIVKCLGKASEAGYQTIALPPVGIGQGYPTDIATETLVRAVIDFCQQGDISLKKVLITVRMHAMIYDVKECISRVVTENPGSIEKTPHSTSAGKGGCQYIIQSVYYTNTTIN